MKTCSSFHRGGFALVFLAAVLGTGPFADAAQQSGSPATPNTLTETERLEGWILLFDGGTTAGWRQFGRDSFPHERWHVEDGWLKLRPVGVRERAPGADLVTVEQFSDFELSWEWRLSVGGNNGIKYMIQEERGAPIGHEYQMIDDAEIEWLVGWFYGAVAKDLESLVGGGSKPPEDLLRTLTASSRKALTGSLYDLLAPVRHTALHPPGRSNFSRIVVRGNAVEHWLNGVKLVDYRLGSPELLAAVAASKFRDVPGFGTKLTGPILLTDHRDETWFRNIKLRRLEPKSSLLLP